MGIGAIYYALKAAEDLSTENILKTELYTVISFIVFTSTIVHGVTVPTFLLASSVHPVWHPKNLIRTGADTGGDESGELPETTEQTTLLKPLTWLAHRYGSTPDEFLDGDEPERGDSSVGKSSSDPDEGEPISRKELHRILHDMADDAEQDVGKSTRRDGQGRLTGKQKRELLKDGSGLEHWDQETEILVYDEGNVLIVCDNEGEYRLATIGHPLIFRRQRIYSTHLSRKAATMTMSLVIILVFLQHRKKRLYRPSCHSRNPNSFHALLPCTRPRDQPPPPCRKVSAAHIVPNLKTHLASSNSLKSLENIGYCLYWCRYEPIRLA